SGFTCSALLSIRPRFSWPGSGVFRALPKLSQYSRILQKITPREARFRYTESPRFREPFLGRSGGLGSDAAGHPPDGPGPIDLLRELVEVSRRHEGLGGNPVEKTEELVDPDRVELALHVVEEEHRVAAALLPVQLDL